MVERGYSELEVWVIFAAPCTPDGILHLFIAGDDVEASAIANHSWPVIFPVQLHRLNRPDTLLWTDGSKQQALELVFLLSVRGEIG